MAVDLIINPADTNIILVSNGSTPNAKCQWYYRSVDGGLNFAHLIRFYLKDYTGRAALALAPSDPTLIMPHFQCRTGIGLFCPKIPVTPGRRFLNRDIPVLAGLVLVLVDPLTQPSAMVTELMFISLPTKATNVSSISWEAYRSGKVGILEEEGSVPHECTCRTSPQHDQPVPPGPCLFCYRWRESL